ncbi:MAG TPA: hypothetical protein VGA48_01850 [Thermoplasmata archaeon]
MTGRVRVFASLLTVAFVAATLLLAVPVSAPPPIPMRVQGQAFDRAGTPLSIATPIRAFVDGVDVEDPFGAHASDTRTVSLTRQSSLAIAVAVLIAIVLGLFLLFAFLRARKKPVPPAGPPPSPPLAPTILPPVGAATVTPGLAPDKKVCPRCHTMVNVIDVTCFFCGYKFPEAAKPPP